MAASHPAFPRLFVVSFSPCCALCASTLYATRAPELLTDLHRLKRTNRGITARAALIAAGSDISAEHVALMNCIFSAQKSEVPIDVCVLAPDSEGTSTALVYLQQAAHMTGIVPANSFAAISLYCTPRRRQFCALSSNTLP